MFGRRVRQLERQLERERSEHRSEQERLLNHILLLTGKPPLEPPPGVVARPRTPEEELLDLTTPDLL